MIKSIIKWVVGSGASGIGKQLNEAYANWLNAKTKSQKIRAESQVDVLALRADILKRESNYKLTRWIRPAFALPFIIYNAKIVVWDSVLGLGETPALPPEFWQLQMIIFGAYFLARPFEKARGGKKWKV